VVVENPLRPFFCALAVPTLLDEVRHVKIVELLQRMLQHQATCIHVRPRPVPLRDFHAQKCAVDLSTDASCQRRAPLNTCRLDHFEQSFGICDERILAPWPDNPTRQSKPEIKYEPVKTTGLDLSSLK
jgi:hypothetical protein